MICRMNKAQRNSLICLIEAIVQEQSSIHLQDVQYRRQMEDEFHKMFENEFKDEDDHNHAE